MSSAASLQVPDDCPGTLSARLVRSPDFLVFLMSHFLFIAGALRERSSQDSAELQLGAGIWGLCTALIRDNLETFVTPQSHGLVYVLKGGICAEFAIVSPVQPFQALDDFLKDELRTEARYGFVRVAPVRRWQGHVQDCQTLLQRVLGIEEQTELTRRLSLGMHRLTDEEYQAILEGLGAGV
ncbi:MAG: hypothetical protein OJF47_001538 [Nitrospira sp.]|nr:MAG: hypothetical protein OJF47_001538 [Nitrospira sp.]